MKELRKKTFKNGVVYCLQLEDGFLVETTDTFLPYYTKAAIGRHQNKLDNNELGDRTERWMIGVSTMSGCPVRCKFCATGNMKRYRNLTAEEIVEQVEFAINKAGADPSKAKEFKINYTRMGEPFLNIDAVKDAIRIITEKYPNTHHYVSTIGIKGSDFSFIKGNITLQISLHSFDDDKRNWLIPYKNKMRKVMQLAHRAYQLKSSSMSWVECLKQAWQVVKLESAMKTKVVEFFFMKMNGEVRQAFGTLLQSHIDYTPNGTGHAASRDCIRYWDEAKGAWRQFKAYNFLRVA